MAYNLQPLITILEQILNPEQTLWIVDHNKPQLESLLQKATSVLQILDESPLTKIESLESQIRDAAHEAENIIESQMVHQIHLKYVEGIDGDLLKGIDEDLLDLLEGIDGDLLRLWKQGHHAGKESHETEDIIESHMVDQMLLNPGAVGLTFSTPDLQPVMQQLDSATEQLAKLMEVKTGSSSGASFSRNVDSVRPKAVVGVAEDFKQLKYWLTGDQKKVEIVSIVGMGGIGKTTLARKLYEDPYIVSHFEYAHAWTTVSQDYNIKAVLLSLLHCIYGKESDHQHAGKEIHELKCILYRSLWHRRYMIVLDDIWSIKFWDEIRNYFPENNMGSRIVITTRESEVAEHASSQSVQHQMQLLKESESWNLLRQEVFGDQEDCPAELQGIGEKISRDCGGLPLAINVMGGLLSKVERSIGVWESIAKNVASAIAEADEQFSNILYLSYSHLPNHLKPCFLYMGAFPGDHKIDADKLVLMWMAEGFVKSNGDKSLEEEAEGCLKALVERNLIFVRKYKYDYSMLDLFSDQCIRKYNEDKFYGMHDLLRDLCIKKSNEDKFFYVGNGRVSNSRRICVVESSVVEEDDDDGSIAEGDDDGSIAEECTPLPLVRSFIIIGRRRIEFEALRLVRVLDVMDARFDEFPMEILLLFNLRFLAVSVSKNRGEIPSGISRLKNLQTLLVKDLRSSLPSVLFEMSELRQLQLIGIYGFEIDEEDMKTIAPNKLQTLYRITITESLIRRGFLESIPDIIYLALECQDYAGAVDLTHLHKLEILSIYSNRWPTFKFPSGLKELVVFDHVMSPSVMMTLCALPNLEVLRMSTCRFAGEDADDDEWEVAEGDVFPSLQVLQIQFSWLVRWRADATNFPTLRHLLLSNCHRLEEIPSSIGEIPTLELIRLCNCSDSVVASARQIVEEQSDYGNYTLQLRIK